MNTLSWLIYAAEVVGNIRVLLGISLAVCAALGVTFVICGLCEEEDRLVKRGSIGVATAFAFGCVLSFVPGSQTIYMIAASQMGEKVITAPETKEVMGDLREVIAKQIKKLKDDK